MDIATILEVAKLSPAALLAAAVWVLWRRLEAIGTAYSALQDKRVAEAQQNTQAMLAVAERVHEAIDRLEELTDRSNR